MSSAPCGTAFAQEALPLRSAVGDLLDLLARGEPQREVRDGLDRQHGLLQARREPALEGRVHVEGAGSAKVRR